MGDLSIVIEDESNMINLWDFSGNPAAFLDDEKGSFIRGDFALDTYRLDGLPYWDYFHESHRPIFTLDADGEVLDNRTFLSIRKENDFALGLGGDYLFRQTDSDYDSHELTYPDFFLVFSKSLSQQTSLGVDLRYREYDFDFTRTDPWLFDWEIHVAREAVKAYRAGAGITFHTSSGPDFGITMGYEKVEVDWTYANPRQGYTPYVPFYAWSNGDFSTPYFWFSVQSVFEVEQKMKLGMELVGKSQGSAASPFEGTSEVRLSLRGLYQLSSRLRLGFLFLGGDSFAEYYEPVYSYISSFRGKEAFAELGTGVSLELHQRVFMGIEYHYESYPQPNEVLEPWRLKTHSVNVGSEVTLSEALSLRAGFIGAGLTKNSDDRDRRETWGNTLTLGCGFQASESNLAFDLCYRYALKRYQGWYGDCDLESERHVLSLSFKKGL